MCVVDLRPDLRMLVGTPGQAYLHRRGDEVLLVDTGPLGGAPAIAAALRDWGLGPEAVTDVVLTHWHADHAGSAAEVATWPNARILVRAADAPVVRDERPGPPPVLTPAEEVLHRPPGPGGGAAGGGRRGGGAGPVRVIALSDNQIA
jgi:glyoxylase-like metal-dependent hydrolase (beta-lactamase superfamily II)